MGIDDRHVERVIQWKAKPLNNLDTLIQRFGRCARNPNTQGLCLLYYEKDCLGDRVLPREGNKGPTSRKRARDPDGKASHSAEEKRGLMESGLYRYINAPGATSSNGNTGTICCRRKVILGYYADQQYNDSSIYTNKCCDLCGTEELNRFASHLLAGILTSKKPPQTRLNNAPPELISLVKSFLLTARTKILALEYPNSKTIINAQIITAKQIDLISAKCQKIASTRDIFSISTLHIDELLGKYGSIPSCIFIYRP